MRNLFVEVTCEVCRSSSSSIMSDDTELELGDVGNMIADRAIQTGGCSNDGNKNLSIIVADVAEVYRQSMEE